MRDPPSVRLGFGGAPIGNLYQAIPDEQAMAAVDAAVHADITGFDTAPRYGLGLGEQRLGAALAQHPRESYTASTKVGRRLESDPDVDTTVARHGFMSPYALREVFDYSYRGVMDSLAASMERLRLQYVDTVYLHDIGRLTHADAHERVFDEALNGGYLALVELREQGVVGAIGLGVNEVEVCIAALERRPFDVVLIAGRYTLLDDSAGATLLPLCRERGTRVVLGGVYASGILATGTTAGAPGFHDYASPSRAILKQVHAIEEVCAAHAVPLPAAALQFARAAPGVDCVLVGLASADEVASTRRWWDVSIPAAFWNALQERGLIAAATATAIASRERAA